MIPFRLLCPSVSCIVELEDRLFQVVFLIHLFIFESNTEMQLYIFGFTEEQDMDKVHLK